MKEFFEFSQGLLERNADNLHQLIEYDTLTNIIQTDEFSVWNKMFIEFKNKVINLTTATLKYMTNLLTEIENKYVNDINQKLLNEN